MTIRRHRKAFAAWTLGVWLFALLVGIASACAPLTAQPGSEQGMAMPAGTGGDDSPSANCLQFCADDTPVLSKLQLMPDQPTGRPLLVATAASLDVPSNAPDVPVVHLAGPPPGVPVLLRSQRLAL